VPAADPWREQASRRGELHLEPAFDFGDERRGLGLANGLARRRALPADLGLDRIECGDAGERFLGERCGAAFGEVAPPSRRGSAIWGPTPIDCALALNP
jgi:hypothetical protein